MWAQAVRTDWATKQRKRGRGILRISPFELRCGERENFSIRILLVPRERIQLELAQEKKKGGGQNLSEWWRICQVTRERVESRRPQGQLELGTESPPEGLFCSLCTSALYFLLPISFLYSAGAPKPHIFSLPGKYCVPLFPSQIL